MGLFSQLTKTVLDVAVTPIAIAADVVTMGGVLSDKDEPYTVTQLKKTAKDANDIPDSIDDGIL